MWLHNMATPQSQTMWRAAQSEEEASPVGQHLFDSIGSTHTYSRLCFAVKTNLNGCKFLLYEKFVFISALSVFGVGAQTQGTELRSYLCRCLPHLFVK